MKRFCLSLLPLLFIFACHPFFLLDDSDEIEEIKDTDDYYDSENTEGTDDSNNEDTNSIEDYYEDPVEQLFDNFESDDQIDQAGYIDFQTPESHTIHTLGDLDFFRFTASAGTEYRILLKDISGFEPELTLYGSENETDIIEMKNTSTYTGSFDWWGYDEDRNFISEEREAIVFTAPEEKDYFFSVRDIYDAHSTGSYTVEVKTIIHVAPPEAFSATPATNQNFQINLSWTGSDDAESYTIYRTDTVQDFGDPQYENFSVLTTVSSDVTAYVDTNIDANTQYTYYVTSTIADTESDPGNADGAIFNWSDFKSNKDIIDASQGLSGHIAVTFKEKYSHSDILRYEVYRADDETSTVYEGPLHSFSASDSIGAVFNDEDVTAGEYYFYCVKIIINIDGVEQESNYSWFDSGVAE